MAPDPDAIADCVLATFDSLPEKRKPRPRTHGGREWVPLAGIVLSQGGTLSCVSLGTGMKCLPQNKLALAKGNVLHDWHAEVVAIRALNRYLLDECVRISTPPYPASNILERSPQNDTTSHRFTIRDNVSLHMYCSEAPCGDASMELTMALQEDATPWTSAPPTLTSTISSPSSDSSTTETDDNATLRGRSNFSHLGVVRAKPSRPDAPPTLSKSCTDKLALKQSLSLLSSTVSLLISPKNAYLDSLILPASQFVPSACERAFSASGRLKDILNVNPQENWKGGYRFQPFTVKTTTREFTWSRRALDAPEKAIASNLSAVWTPTWQETLIGGVLQGRKQFDTRGASRISRRAMWTECLAIAAIIGSTALSATLNSSSRKGKRTYGDVKGCVERQRVKNDMRAVLKGWVRNEGDDDWSLSESFITTM